MKASGRIKARASAQPCELYPHRTQFDNMVNVTDLYAGIRETGVYISRDV